MVPIVSRLTLIKGNLTIPRLDLVAGHTPIHLVTNVQAALNTYPVQLWVHCCLD